MPLPTTSISRPPSRAKRAAMACGIHPGSLCSPVGNRRKRLPFESRCLEVLSSRTAQNKAAGFGGYSCCRRPPRPIVDNSHSCLGDKPCNFSQRTLQVFCPEHNSSFAHQGQLVVPFGNPNRLKAECRWDRRLRIGLCTSLG